MVDNKHRVNCIKDNEGSVMITVIVTFLFISILVAIIMSTTLMNLRMKAVERNSKDEFYYVEKSLNDIYSGVGKECAMRLGEVYSETLGASYNYMDESLAYEKFCYEYVKDLVQAFYGTAGNVDLKDKLNGYLTDKAKAKALVNNAGNVKVQFIKEGGDATPIDTPNSGEYKEYRKIILKDIYVSSVDTSNYKSSITTDIVIQIPEISFFKINENELDYALVGCKGIVFNGIDDDVRGNVFGGVDKRKQIEQGGIMIDNPAYLTGGIQVNKTGATQPDISLVSNYVVSAGDVTVNDAILKIENGHSTNDNEVWLENVVVGRKDSSDNTATVVINGDTYALNDLQIEGKDKKVSLKGNYYGYGDGGNSSLSPKESQFKPISSTDEYYDTDARSKSSSIIVNATESELDLSGLKNLIILGQAYIDHGSKFDSADSENTPKIGNASEAKLSNDETGMSGTIKASQELLLVPEQFLTTSNPMRLENLSDNFSVDTAALNQWILDNFGGRVKLNSAPTRTVKFQKNSKVYAYCYLAFDDTNEGDADKYRSEYIKAILNCDIRGKSSDTEPTLQSLKKRAVAAAESQNSEIITDGISNVYAKNAGIISFVYGFETDEHGNIKVDAENNKIKERFTPFRENNIKIVNNESDVAGYAGSVGSLSGKYKDLCTYLDYNAKFSRGVQASDYADDDYPFGRLWWRRGIEADTSGETKKEDFAGCRVIIQGNNTLELGKYLSEYPMDESLKDGDYSKLIVISTGDVIIDKDLKMEGFIFSKGKVIVNDSVTTLDIKSDLAVVQKRISAEVADVKSNMPIDADDNDINDAYKIGYLIRYLLKTEFDNNTHKLIKHCEDTNVIGNRRYNISTKETSDSSTVINSDYTSFIRFDRWRKTGAGGQ